MNVALLMFLALVWAVFLVPGALRSRRSSPTTSVGTFERAMTVLARGGETVRRSEGRLVYVPRDAARIVGDREHRRREVVARRRRLFLRLLAVAATSLVVAMILGGATWLLAVATAGVLAGYTSLLRLWKIQADQAAEVVRELPDVVIDINEPQRQLMAVGAEERLPPGLQVATHPDDPWEPSSGVRIRRFQD